MKTLIKTGGFVGDHLFAAGIAEDLDGTIDYCVTALQVFELFNNDPNINNIMHASQLTPEIERTYDRVFTLPDVDQSIPPPLYFRQHCGIENGKCGYKIYTNKGLDQSVEVMMLSGKKNIAYQANWEEKSFIYTKEEYEAGVDKPPAGYGGKRRNIKYIVSELQKDYNMIRVGFPNGTPNDPVTAPMGGLATAGIYSNTASIIKACDFMIGGESGLINLAAGVGTKTIITGDFVHQLYGWNGCIKKIKEPKLGPEFYFPNDGHVSLDPFLTDKEVVTKMRSIINE